jgi:hypothetical protein
MSAADLRIERVTRIAIAAGDGAWPLSTSETLAAALALGKLDRLQGDDAYRGWTVSEALGRIGPDWAAAVCNVGNKLRAEGVIS